MPELPTRQRMGVLQCGGRVGCGSEVDLFPAKIATLRRSKPMPEDEEAMSASRWPGRLILAASVSRPLHRPWDAPTCVA